jgi:hypothetical protein
LFRKDSPSATNIEGRLHVDRYLTNYSVQFVQDARNFVAQRAASVIPVQKQTDIYVVYERGYFWRDEAQPRPLGGRPQQVSYKISEGNYNASEYGLEATIDDRQRANADEPIRLDENATTLLTQKHMIKQDRVWSTNFFTTGKWTHELQGVNAVVGPNNFLNFNDAQSTPIEVIDEQKDNMARRTGFMPNTLVLGAAVKRALRTHPDISDRIKYTQTGIADDDILATLFEVDTVITARSVFNSADEGATDNFQFIADEKSMLLAYIEPNAALDSPTALANFAWTGLIPGEGNAIGGVITRGREDRARSDWIQNSMAWDLRQVAADLAVFFNEAVSSSVS